MKEEIMDILKKGYTDFGLGWAEKQIIAQLQTAQKEQRKIDMHIDWGREYVKQIQSETLKKVIEEIENMPIKTVGNSAKTIDQVLKLLKSKLKAE